VHQVDRVLSKSSKKKQEWDQSLKELQNWPAIWVVCSLPMYFPADGKKLADAFWLLHSPDFSPKDNAFRHQSKFVFLQCFFKKSWVYRLEWHPLYRYSTILLYYYTPAFTYCILKRNINWMRILNTKYVYVVSFSRRR